MTRVRRLSRKVTEVKDGKSVGSAKPPNEGSPVRLPMSKESTPGNPGRLGINTSYESVPRSKEARSTCGSRSVNNPATRIIPFSVLPPQQAPTALLSNFRGDLRVLGLSNSQPTPASDIIENGSL